MAEFPALPLWTDAFLSDTLHLGAAECGNYLRLLMHMWRSPGCRVPNDDRWLASRFHISIDQVQSQIRPIIAEFCKSDGNWITQKRLMQEFEYLSNKSGRQSARASERWRDNKIKRSERMAAARRRGTHTAQEWAILKDIFRCCVHCGATDRPLEKDHIMPVYQGGSDAIENLQPSCAPCNSRKGPECLDKRLKTPAANACDNASWILLFEQTAGRKLLKNLDGSVCVNGCQMAAADTAPTPTPIKKERKRDQQESTEVVFEGAKGDTPFDPPARVVLSEHDFASDDGSLVITAEEFEALGQSFPSLKNIRGLARHACRSWLLDVEPHERKTKFVRFLQRRADQVIERPRPAPGTGDWRARSLEREQQEREQREAAHRDAMAKLHAEYAEREKASKRAREVMERQEARRRARQNGELLQ